MRLKGKAAIITGATGGIGMATARKFAAEGAAVVVADLDAARVDEAVASLVESGARAIGARVDVTDRASVEAMAAAALAAFGRIDCLVNNAGITQDARLVKMSEEQFDRVIDVNLKGVFLCTQAVADAMISPGSGVILNASVGGRRWYGHFGQTNLRTRPPRPGRHLAFTTKTWRARTGPKGVRADRRSGPGFVRTT